MIKKLHFQLTIFATIVTTCILIIVSAISLRISEGHMRHADEYSLQNNFSAILNYLEEQTIISHKWLSTTEANHNFYIKLDDNGTDLLFDSLRKNAIKSRAFDMANVIAKDTYNFSLTPTNDLATLSRSISFPFSVDESEKYHAFIAVIPKHGGYLNITILHSYGFLEQQILRQRTAFGIAIAGSFILLAVFFYFLIGFLLKPIKKNREEQTRFIASASHELRSPLTVILSSLSAMEHADDKQRIHFSHTIKSESKRMALLIDDLLTLSRVDSIAWDMNFASTELDTLVLRCYEKFEPLAQSKLRVFEVSLPNGKLPACVCDEFRIEQLLIVLIDNAFSYTNENDIISLSLQYKNNYFYIAVSDTGIGITDNDKAYIFERFYRSDKSRKDKSHFGLGLSIAKEIVDLHNGNIRVYDTDGGGSTFQVKLPVGK